MYLKRLELQGYKSFANKTEFEFGSGITVIVGPNGSGKSNIADAVRWALGEQSYNILRAKRTEDMIFAGSAQRSRLGMAQVSLTLDNAEGWLASGHEERLTAAELLLEAGPPDDGPAHPPEEKLTPAELLLRAGPSEVTIARRAYRSGENEYLLNGNHARLRDVTELLAKGGLGRSSYTVIGQGLVDAALSLRPEERRSLFEEAAGIKLYQAKRDNVWAKLEETQGNILRLKDIINEIAPRLERLGKRAERARQHAQISHELEGLLRSWYGYQWPQGEERLRQARVREQKGKEALAQQRAALQELNSRMAQVRERQRQMRRDLEGWRKESSDLRAQAAEAQQAPAVSRERLRLTLQQRGELERELETLEANRAAHLKRSDAVQAALEKLEQEREKRLTAIQEIEERLEQRLGQGEELQQELESAQESAFQWATKSADLQTRYELLAKMRHDLTGYRDGVKVVMSRRDELGGILGLVADLMEVPPELEVAIEAALGPHLQDVVVESWEDAERTIEWLKNTGGGRATFLPLDGVEGTKGFIAGAEGVIGLASDLVKFEARYAPLFAALLGSTLVVNSLATARRLMPTPLRLVTLAGEVIEPSGAITGGSAHAEEKRLNDEMETLRGKEATLAQEIEQAEKEKAAVLEAIASLKERLDGLAIDDLRNRVSQMRTALAITEGHLESQRELLRSHRASLEPLEAQIAAKRERVAELNEEAKELSNREEGLSAQAENLGQRMQALAHMIQPAESDLVALERLQRELEDEELRRREELHRSETMHNQALLEAQQSEDRLANLRRQMEADFELIEMATARQSSSDTDSLVSSLPSLSEVAEGLEEEIGQLKRRLKSIGPVDPHALAEYEEALARHDFLTAQVADLQRAAQDLQAVISELDRLMKEEFGATFSAVAAEFERYFKRLFGGGSAKLVLTEPENLTEAGVDIVARPPGRRQQRLALLSGGERALTAVALLFAILKVRPSPFCILDEVDATMDDVNIGRFSQTLRELSERTQFIVITHNRGTIEIADTIYGVSMGEDGVSQVLSLKLDKDSDI